MKRSLPKTVVAMLADSQTAASSCVLGWWLKRAVGCCLEVVLTLPDTRVIRKLVSHPACRSSHPSPNVSLDAILESVPFIDKKENLSRNKGQTVFPFSLTTYLFRCI